MDPEEDEDDEVMSPDDEDDEPLSSVQPNAAAAISVNNTPAGRMK